MFGCYCYKGPCHKETSWSDRYATDGPTGCVTETHFSPVSLFQQCPIIWFYRNAMYLKSLTLILPYALFSSDISLSELYITLCIRVMTENDLIANSYSFGRVSLYASTQKFAFIYSLQRFRCTSINTTFVKKHLVSDFGTHFNHPQAMGLSGNVSVMIRFLIHVCILHVLLLAFVAFYEFRERLHFAGLKHRNIS